MVCRVAALLLGVLTFGATSATAQAVIPPDGVGDTDVKLSWYHRYNGDWSFDETYRFSYYDASNPPLQGKLKQIQRSSGAVSMTFTQDNFPVSETIVDDFVGGVNVTWVDGQFLPSTLVDGSGHVGQWNWSDWSQVVYSNSVAISVTYMSQLGDNQLMFSTYFLEDPWFWYEDVVYNFATPLSQEFWTNDSVDQVDIYRWYYSYDYPVEQVFYYRDLDTYDAAGNYCSMLIQRDRVLYDTNRNGNVDERWDSFCNNYHAVPSDYKVTQPLNGYNLTLESCDEFGWTI